MAPTLSVLNYIQAASLSLLSGSSKKKKKKKKKKNSKRPPYRAVNKCKPL